jgi:protein required for attachment to host cells
LDVLQTDSGPNFNTWLSDAVQQDILIDSAGDPAKIIRNSLVVLYNSEEMANMSAAGQGKNPRLQQDILIDSAGDPAKIIRNSLVVLYNSEEMANMSAAGQGKNPRLPKKVAFDLRSKYLTCL